jgi:ubiquinone/menaquinone biosynthesis C-methylase UbiE
MRTPYDAEAYWRSIAKMTSVSSGSPLSAVIHPGVPEWFNRVVARDQTRAIQWALGRCPDLQGKHALDVGAGIGRWSAWLSRYSATMVSTDLTRAMLEHGVRLGWVSRPVQATAYQLPFRTGTFDVVLSVTVVQHIPARQQLSAVKELARVCRSGGRVIFLELIASDDTAPHVFPRPPEWWIDQFVSSGMKLVAWRGQEFLPTERLLRRLMRQSTTQLTAGQVCDGPSSTITQPSVLRTVKITGRAVQYLFEPLWLVALPDRWARHGIFIFSKESATHD